jgi:hypothetical protein
MKIQMLIVADYASVDLATGKLNILGAFTRINAKQFPTIHNRLAVAVKLTAEDPLENTQPRNFRLVLTDDDGLDLFQLSNVVSLKRDANANLQDANVIIEINALEFPHPGIYEFGVYIDDKKIGDTPIQLTQF